ncbi:MAG: MFS transporter [Woeseiaceae bacterium]|nr:MFS transporter [Woeseiaceae bacterium]
MTRYLYIIVLVVAGEMVFGLPFHTVRFFRPTILEVFGLTHTELGYLLGAYGIAAMLSYFPGGALADRYSARTLLTLSLFATGAGGLYIATLPGAAALGIVNGFWGVTTVFLFWGALIRATREWGGQSSQGAAFGILEAGRGITQALFAVLAVAIFAVFMPENGESVTAADREAGLSAVYLVYSSAAFATGVLVWFTLPQPGPTVVERRNPFPNMLIVLQKPIVWAQAAVIVCAYCCFRATDYYVQYLVVVLGMDEVDGARWGSYGSFVRPVAALAAGIIADRFSATRSIGVAFVVLAIVFTVLSMLMPGVASLSIIIANMAVTLVAVFSLRGIYFALLQETKTPRHITGATVGLISFIGYTPDFFFPWVTGVILDADAGFTGFRNLFYLLAAIAATGVAVVAWLMRLNRLQDVK